MDDSTSDSNGISSAAAGLLESAEAVVIEDELSPASSLNSSNQPNEAITTTSHTNCVSAAGDQGRMERETTAKGPPGPPNLNCASPRLAVSTLESSRNNAMSRFVAGAHYSSNNNTATGDIQSPEYNYASHQLPHSSVQNQRLRAKELTSKEPPLSQTEVRHYLQSPKHNSPRLLANELERNVKTGTSSDTEILFEPRLPLSDEPRQYFDNSNRRSSGSDNVQSTTTDESLSKHLQERELQEGHRPTMGTEFTIMRNLNERNITDRRQGRDEATLWSSDQSAEDQLSTDEELALKLHEEWNSPTIAKRTQSEDEDLELAAKIANILIDEVSTQQPSQNDVVFTQNTSSIEVQRLIFEQIRRDREQRRLNKSSHSGTQSPHQDITSTREAISKDVTPILAEQKQLQDSRDRSQRRKEAFERQFKDRASGRVEVTAADREHALNESLDQHALHGDERAQLQNTTSPFRPAQCTLSYSQQQHSPPTSPTDWELSQRQALMEYEEARMQRSSRLRVSLSAPVGSDHQNLYPWQHNRISQQLPRSDIYEDDYRRREDLLRRGQSMTEMAVRTGQSHIVMCHGCGNRLQAPVHSSLVYCPSCGVVSPGLAVRQPAAFARTDRPTVGRVTNPSNTWTYDDTP